MSNVSNGLGFAAQRLATASQAYEAGRPADAMRLLDAVLLSDPRSAQALLLSGLCLIDLGDFAQAERALRASLASDKRQPAVHAALGHALRQSGRAAEAETAYRAGLAVDRLNVDVAFGLADLLIAMGRADKALQITTPLAAGAKAPPQILAVHAQALKRLGRLEEALAMARRAVAAGAPFGEIDVAAILRDLGRSPEAEAAARRAVGVTGDHPVVMNLLACTLVDQDRYDEAEAVYRRGLVQAPFDPALHLSLARLLWSRTGDPEQAAAPLDAAMQKRATPDLLSIRAKLYTRAGRPEAAYAMLAEAVKHIPDDPLLLAAAATAAVHAGDLDVAVGYAERAESLGPGVEQFRTLLAETCLASGRPERANEIIADLLKAAPERQQYLAIQAVAWRLTGDDRYRDLYDYDAMVQAFTIPTPQGWSSLPAYLADLARVLRPMHAMRGDPLDQSVRKGVQTERNLVLSDDPVLQAFFKAVDEPIGQYIARIGQGADPLRRRGGRGRRLNGAWSVSLEPNGFHADHLHPEGWLSSAFYVEVPEVVSDDDRQGWIKFGQPGAPTRPALEAEHFVRPEPGRLVLFPSYMWHGTVPFGGTQKRLTMAFDVTPAR